MSAQCTSVAAAAEGTESWEIVVLSDRRVFFQTNRTTAFQLIA